MQRQSLHFSQAESAEFNTLLFNLRENWLLRPGNLKKNVLNFQKFAHSPSPLLKVLLWISAARSSAMVWDNSCGKFPLNQSIRLYLYSVLLRIKPHTTIGLITIVSAPVHGAFGAGPGPKGWEPWSK